MNSASRIYKIFEKLKPPIHNSHTLSDAICNIFNFSSKDITVRNHFALSKLILIRDEIEKARNKVKEYNKIQEARYDETFNKLYQVLNSEIINQSWPNYFSSLPQGFFNIIGICADIIEKEEEEISDKELEPIWKIIKEWRKQIEDGNYTEELKSFILKSIEIIEEGLRNYLIIGVQAFKASYLQTHIHIMQNPNIVNNDNNKEDISKIKIIGQQILIYSEKASKTIKLIETTGKLIDYGKNIFNLFS